MYFHPILLGVTSDLVPEMIKLFIMGFSVTDWWILGCSGSNTFRTSEFSDNFSLNKAVHQPPPVNGIAVVLA